MLLGALDFHWRTDGDGVLVSLCSILCVEEEVLSPWLSVCLSAWISSIQFINAFFIIVSWLLTYFLPPQLLDQLT